MSYTESENSDDADGADDVNWHEGNDSVVEEKSEVDGGGTERLMM